MTPTFKELADGLRDAALGPEGGRREFIASCSKNADVIIQALERAAKLESRAEEAELDSDAVINIRRITKAATGGNCTFVDDDVRLIVTQRDDSLERAGENEERVKKLEADNAHLRDMCKAAGITMSHLVQQREALNTKGSE